MYVLWADDNAAASGDNVGEPHEGCYTIDNIIFATHTIGTMPPTIVQQPVGTNVNERQVARLNVTATGTAPLSYQWYKGNPPSGVAVAGATSDIFFVTNTAGSGRAYSVPSDSGKYYVIVTGAANPPATSTAVTVTVTADTTAPRFTYAVCDSADLSLIKVFLSEPVQNPNPVPPND